MSGTRFWNQTRPKYKGEPIEHVQAKERVTKILMQQVGYKSPIYEWETPFLKYRGRWQKFPIDARYDHRDHDIHRTLFVQFDGGYHEEGRNVGKTKNRTQVQQDYCDTHGYGYIVLRVDDCLSQTKEWILCEIWRQLFQQRIRLVSRIKNQNQEEESA